ncbi:MAG: 3-dehydroquinate synthase [Actinomycetota bacterium]|nr:3-dehydroquinate synthase [Actinomycetota bacterium]
MIALVGFMGAGKTTVGRLLAARIGLPFVDADAAVEAAAGTTIDALFEKGEASFRELESRTVRALLDGPEAVVALGGGALGDPSVATALQWATVVFLDVSFREAMRRLSGAADRPMLRRADPKALYESRRDVYERAAHHVVPVDGKTAEDVAAEVAALLGRPDQAETTGRLGERPLNETTGRLGERPLNETTGRLGERPRSETTGRLGERPRSERRVPVPLGDRSYDVVVGRDLLARLADVVPLPADAEKAVVVTHPELEEAAAEAAASLAAAGLKTHTLTVPSGEASKSFAAAQGLLTGLADLGAHRHDLLVGFGGGVVTDLAGFVASVYHRGMPVVHVATTLLAQVDAAIGGKTAVNLPQGKNLAGTFHQPRAVVCDVGVLRTLPDAELVAGLAEVVKYGLIADPALLGFVIERAREIRAKDAGVLTEIVTRSAAIKAGVVARDETESGARAHLNYGHTFGHAMEHVAAATAAPLRHGEAIALGMMAAAFAAQELGRIDEDTVTAHRRPLEAAGLPVSAAFDLTDLEDAWRHDKKYRRGVRFVLLAGLGRPEAGVEVGRDTLWRALRRLSE